MRRRLHDLDGITAQEPPRILGDLNAHQLPRYRVSHKDHVAVMPRHHMSTMRNRASSHLNHAERLRSFVCTS